MLLPVLDLAIGMCVLHAVPPLNGKNLYETVTDSRWAVSISEEEFRLKMVQSVAEIGTNVKNIKEDNAKQDKAFSQHCELVDKQIGGLQDELKSVKGFVDKAVGILGFLVVVIPVLLTIVEVVTIYRPNSPNPAEIPAEIHQH